MAKHQGSKNVENFTMELGVLYKQRHEKVLNELLIFNTLILLNFTF